MQWQYDFQFVVCALSAVRRVTAVTRRTALNTHTVYRLKLILPLHTNNFNDVF